MPLQSQVHRWISNKQFDELHLERRDAPSSALRHRHGHAPPQPHLLIASQGPKGWPDGIHRTQHQHRIGDDVDGEYRPHRAGPGLC